LVGGVVGGGCGVAVFGFGEAVADGVVCEGVGVGVDAVLLFGEELIGCVVGPGGAVVVGFGDVGAVGGVVVVVIEAGEDCVV